MLPIRWRCRLRLLFPAIGGFVLGTLLGAPMTFFKPITVWRDILTNIRFYGSIHSPQGYFVQAISMLELGVPLLLAGSVGILLMLRQKKTRTGVLAWISFAVVLIAVFLNSPFRPFRSFLPLVPPACIAAALAFSDLIDWGRRGARPWLPFGANIVLIGGSVLSLGFSSFQQVQRRMVHQDSRIQAVDWFQQHATREATVLSIRELAILPHEYKRLGARCIVVPWFEALDLLERQRFDYIVTGEFDLRDATDPNGWSAYREHWKAKVSPLPIQANFGQVPTPVVPYLWRTNDERILILKSP